MRDFQYNEEEMKADKEEMTRLSTDKKKQFVRLLFSLLLINNDSKRYRFLMLGTQVPYVGFISSFWLLIYLK